MNTPFFTLRRSVHHAFCLVCIVCCCLVFFLQSCKTNIVIDLDESGTLLVEDLVVGTGEVVPKDTSIAQLSVRYTAKLTDGTVFQTSTTASTFFVLGTTYTGGQSLVLGIDSLRGMRVGGKRRLTIPPRLAFGTSSPNSIPANSTVIYEVQLFSMQKMLIEDIVSGIDGDSAVTGKTLKVRYVGRLLNGNVFDTNIYSSSDFSFALGAGTVIRGWDVGLINMKVGGTRRLTIPSELAYKAAGSPPKIPANAPLVFDITLDAIE